MKARWEIQNICIYTNLGHFHKYKVYQHVINLHLYCNSINKILVMDFRIVKVRTFTFDVKKSAQ